jgi:tRNA 5-methylaminomethyl-2-thiouridine biosynthesis bifunctional protein
MQKPPASNPTPSLSEANIEWDEQSQPISSNFDDVYFSRANGIEETGYVFMAQNRLPERWNAFADDDSDSRCFTIGETGFGTGLNFLVAAKAWLEETTTGTLHFVSVEKFPLSKADLQQALYLWPQLVDKALSNTESSNTKLSNKLPDLIEELLQHYPPAVAGIHRLNFTNHRIVLTLMYGDATEMFGSLKGSDHPLFKRQGNPIFDAWFLDGFAPAKNPEMWTEKLFQTIADLSNTCTTFSTFSAAGIVRRGLKNVGFEVQKVPGFGYKREMLKGEFKPASTPDVQETKEKDWQPTTFNSPHQPPWYLQSSPKIKPKRAIVIGGGIAGCSTARALAERGVAVTLIERHNNVGQEASGNPQGILYPKLSTGDSLLSRFGLMALLNASRYHSSLLDNTELSGNKILGQRCGVLLLPQSEKNQSEFKKIAQRYPKEMVQLLEGEQLNQKAGLPLESNTGLFFPQLGWIKPPTACQLLTEHPLIQVKTAEVGKITFTDDQWQALDKHDSILDSAQTMVIACSFDSSRFTQANHLPLKKIRGQITNLPSTRQSERLLTVICGEGYIAPTINGIHTLGATYNFDETSAEVRPSDHQINLNQLAETDQAVAKSFSETETTHPLETISGRAAFRCTTPDYLPIAGPAPKLNSYVENYQLLKKNARSHIPIAGDCYPGLYLNIGHGSRGLSYAPICAELVASHICNEAPPLELDLRKAIHPGRFIIRDLKRNKR